MKCERCGRNVPVRSKVCPNCGKDNPNYQPYTPPVQHAYTQNTSAAQPTGTANSQPAAAASAKKSSIKTLLLLALVVIAVVFVVKKCSADRLVGTWVANDGSSITFSDSENGYLTDGSSMYSERTIDFTYFIDGDEVEIKTENSMYSYARAVRFEFEVSGSKLTLTDMDTDISETFYKE